MPRNAIIIPARYESTRFPGKPLHPITGHSGASRSLVEWTWRNAMTASDGDYPVYVATDSRAIAQTVREFGGVPVMVPEMCDNGTERVAIAAGILGMLDTDVVVNVQGDACLIPPSAIRALMYSMLARGDDGASVGTVVYPMYRRPIPGEVSAVLTTKHQALYFSRSLIPFPHSDVDQTMYRHAGVYGYTGRALSDYLFMHRGNAEMAEGLEQLRFLEHGRVIQCVIAETHIEPYEVNHPSDVERVEMEMAKWSIG